MKKYLFFILELSNLLFLVKGPTSVAMWIAFFVSHTIVVGLLYGVLGEFVVADGYLRSRIGPRFIIKTLPLAAIPVFGPLFVLELLALLKILKNRYRELSLYETFPLERVEASSGIYSGITGVPDRDLIEFLYGKAQEAAFRWVHYIKSLPWNPFKVKFLRFILDYAREASIVLEASRQLEEKRSDLFERIKQAESNKDLFLAASLYHEIYSISLEDPISNHHYLERACYYLEKAVKEGLRDVKILVNLGEWSLEARMLNKAEYYLEEAKKLPIDESLGQKIFYLIGVVNLLRGKL